VILVIDAESAKKNFGKVVRDWLEHEHTFDYSVLEFERRKNVSRLKWTISIMPVYQ